MHVYSTTPSSPRSDRPTMSGSVKDVLKGDIKKLELTADTLEAK